MRKTPLIATAGSLLVLMAGVGAPSYADDIALDGIVVYGAAEAETGVPGVAIGYEELQLKAPSDLQDVFSNKTSVSVGGSTAVSQKVYVYGLEDSQLAVTVDGAKQSNAVFHHAGTLLLDPELLKAAKVNPIVAPADQGPGALGGSIEFETVDVKDLLKAGDNHGGFVTTSYDTNSNTFTAAAAGYTRGNGVEFLGYYKIADGDDWTDGAGKIADATAPSLKSGLAKLAFEGKGGDRIELSYQGVQDDGIRPYRANFGAVIRPGVTYPNQPYDLKRQTVTLSYTDETPKGLWDPTFLIAYNHTRLDTFPTYGSFADIRTINGKFENKFALSKGDVTAGIDFHSIKSEGGGTSGSGTEKDKNVGLYTQARLTPTDKSRVSFGGRIDHQMFEGLDGTQIDNTGFSGNVAGEYDLNDIFTLRAGYAHVFGRIPLAEAMLNYNPYKYDGVEPFSSNNFTVGLTAKYKGFTFNTGYNVVLMDDAISYNPHNPAKNRDETSDIESRSFDVGLGYAWSSGFVKASYTNIEVTEDGQPIGTTAFYYGTNMGEIIKLQALHKFAGTGLTIGGDVEIALDIDKEDVAAGGEAIPGYEVVNVFAQYEPAAFPNLTLRAEVKNVFDELYSDRATSGQEYSIIEPLREPGRTLYLKAKAKF